MSINIQAKGDYSFMFSSLGGNTGSSGNNFLSDYYSIKNGSYKKLMKAYFSEDSSKEVKSVASKTNQNKVSSGSNTSVMSKEDTKAYKEVQKSTDNLRDSADKLLTNGIRSVFNKKDITTKDENGVESTEKGYDTNAIYNAVNDFVKNYNSVIDAAKNVDNNIISNRVTSMENNTSANAKSLDKIGITINKDNTLSIDKDKFMAADMGQVKSLFNGAGSYGYNVSASASLINYNADYALSRATTYTNNGSYNNAYSTGNLFGAYL